jgi:hypothetical protein
MIPEPETAALFINHEIIIPLSRRLPLDLGRHKSPLINYVALKGLLKEVLICDEVDESFCRQN